MKDSPENSWTNSRRNLTNGPPVQFDLFGWRVYERANAMRVPLLMIAIEHYGRMERLLERGVPVRA